MAKKKREKKVVGWKEQVALPDLKIKSVMVLLFLYQILPDSKVKLTQ